MLVNHPQHPLFIQQQQFEMSNSPPPQMQRSLYSSNEISPFGSTIEGPYYAPLRSPQQAQSLLPPPVGRHFPQSLSSIHRPMPSSAQATPTLRPHTMTPSSTITTDTNDGFDGRLRSATSLPTTPVRPTTTTSSDKQDSPKPLPQNLRGDPFRSAKVKTELCRFFNTEQGCVFGDKCNYAHGEHELKFNKLMDLERAGLVDVEVFRCHVCFTWVATGAW